jgi:hypothetical protein
MARSALFSLLLHHRRSCSQQVHLGPITSLYSEVWWKNVPAVPLPDDLIQRFKGKGMAIVGCMRAAIEPSTDLSHRGLVRMVPPPRCDLTLRLCQRMALTDRLFNLTARTDETDAVRRTPAGDVSVPINMAYNHHHDVYLTGKHSQMADVPYDPLDVTIPMMARSNPHHLTLPVETSASPLGLPTSLHLADGNGGECTRAPSLCSPRLL